MVLARKILKMAQLSSTFKVKPLMTVHQQGKKSAREEIYHVATSCTLLDCTTHMS